MQRKLLEHRSSVLSYSVRTLEKKLLPGNGNDVGGNGMGNGNGMSSGYSTPNRSSSQMTPTSPSSTASGLTASSSRGRFDGAHFFAGHSDAVVPQLPRAPPTLVEVLELEEKLRGMGLTLEEERTRRGEVMRELEEERRGREELERELRVELHDADEMVGTLEREVSKLEDYEAQVKYLEGEREVLLKERAELEEKRREVDTLERRMKVLEEQNAEGAATGDLLAKEHESHRLELEQKERELEEVKSMWESDKVAWELERTTLEGEITQSAASARREAEEEGKEKLNEVFEALKSLMQSHGILLVARENTLPAMISSVGTHVEGLNTRLGAFTQAQDEWIALRAKLEADVRGGLDKRESLMGELEQTKKERDEANDMSKLLDEQLKVRAFIFLSLFSRN